MSHSCSIRRVAACGAVLAAVACREDTSLPTGPREPAGPEAASAPAPLVFRYISAGSSHSCGVTTTNKLYCWGDNFLGQLGDGTRTNHPLPTPVKSAPQLAQRERRAGLHLRRDHRRSRLLLGVQLLRPSGRWQPIPDPNSSPWPCSATTASAWSGQACITPAGSPAERGLLLGTERLLPARRWNQIKNARPTRLLQEPAVALDQSRPVSHLRRYHRQQGLVRRPRTSSGQLGDTRHLGGQDPRVQVIRRRRLGPRGVGIRAHLRSDPGSRWPTAGAATGAATSATAADRGSHGRGPSGCPAASSSTRSSRPSTIPAA